ncbi:hypothetical protein [Cloacibacterium sp.]|uniref:hypothetical protein n=1 Tax=Cloacibacterium sp. TaxID=1913682 RepID=UPI0039E66ACD
MYYLELIQRFWEFNKNALIGSNAIAMYLYLLKLGNDSKSYCVSISDVKLSKILKISRKTIQVTKEKLSELGLIKYVSRNGLPCNYLILLNYPLQKEIKLNEELKNNRVDLQIKNTEDDNDSELIRFLEVNNIAQDANLNDETLIRMPKLSSNIVDMPSLEEFMKYAKSLKDYDPELDLSITKKYENWRSNNWKNASNRPISNWKSTLKSTLPYLKNSNEEHSISLQDIPNIKRIES